MADTQFFSKVGRDEIVSLKKESDESEDELFIQGANYILEAVGLRDQLIQITGRDDPELYALFVQSVSEVREQAGRKRTRWTIEGAKSIAIGYQNLVSAASQEEA